MTLCSGAFRTRQRTGHHEGSTHNEQEQAPHGRNQKNMHTK